MLRVLALSLALCAAPGGDEPEEDHGVEAVEAAQTAVDVAGAAQDLGELVEPGRARAAAHGDEVLRGAEAVESIGRAAAHGDEAAAALGRAAVHGDEALGAAAVVGRHGDELASLGKGAVRHGDDVLKLLGKGLRIVFGVGLFGWWASRKRRRTEG
jgi:hypothetical protein